MDYKKIVTGALDVNTYVVPHPNGNGTCLVIDPSDHCGDVVAYIQKENLRPLAILLTHGHFDHIMGIPDILGAFGSVPVFIHDGDRERLADPMSNGSVLMGGSFSHTENVESLTEGKMSIGAFEFDVLYTPGHTQGGCDFLFDGVCFCGDTIFAGSVGRTDLPGGNGDQLIDSINAKILTLPPQTILCPGHGGRTSVEREKRTNPYLN